MIPYEINDFCVNFHDEIHTEAIITEALREEIFIRKIGEILEEYGEIEALVPCQFQATGVKVDGYCYDDEFKVFTLIVSHFLDETNIANSKVTNTDIEKLMKRVTNFFDKCLKGYKNKIEISNEAYELSKLIYECRDEIRTVKFVLITDGVAPKKTSETEDLNGIDVSKTIWDIERIFHFFKTGEREQISINFYDYCDGPLKCVYREEVDSSYTTYLGFLPGEALADMYGIWGIKMLDMNVRVFLSARGKVNSGIRKTIKNAPEMFCAYNNGITVFARGVTLTKDGTGLIKAQDFQIVNGGQTTASLYHTRKKDKANLSNVNVQMKLTVIHDESKIDEIVPRISEYSNTQNKVQTADLAANEAPHPEIQAISKCTPAPDPTGGSLQTFWFYEKARGSYEEYKNLTAKTAAQKTQFSKRYPKSQKFDKIKFAKAWNSYLRIPYVVSLGGQKNFAIFNNWLREQKNENWESFFKNTISLLIIWNKIEKIVRKNKFNGYHHNIVAYSLSWFFHMTNSMVDLEKIWKNQNADEIIFNILNELTFIVDRHIRNTSYNVTEYCKKKDCWDKLIKETYDLPTNIEKEYFSDFQKTEYSTEVESSREAIKFCCAKGADSWFKLSKWLKDRDFLTPKARSQCYNMGKAISNGKEPSDRLSVPCHQIWKDAEIRGWKNTESKDE